MPDKVSRDPMTDERPAEPDTRQVRNNAIVLGHSRPSSVTSEDINLIEAAARLCAIEYAESRVRAIADEICLCGNPKYVPECVCDAHAELAALARLKEQP